MIGPSHGEDYYEIIDENVRIIKKFNSECHDITLRLKPYEKNENNLYTFLENAFNNLIQEFVKKKCKAPRQSRHSV